MHFGWEKYELFQDTSQAKVLAGLVLLKLNGQSVDEEQMRTLASNVLDVPADATDDLCSNQVLHEMTATFMAKKSDIDPAESVFLLRSLDPLAAEVIEIWIARAKVKGVSSDRIKSAEAQLAKMRQYALNHADQKV